ncbi:MAG: PTS fructose transporter subunit IIB [Candidatus Aminicenantes bacterium]|jgi:fructose-specific phosphotransferase system IIB component|nr:PTS fructose transporter subunit IIB [Candidatus Aminicenantes bacterium]
MTIVGITACPTGIAHTYMAAERLEKAGKKMGLRVKIETQGAMGIENELTAEDIREAAAVIFAVGIPVRRKERFEGKTIYEIGVQEAIKNAEAILLKIQNELGR